MFSYSGFVASAMSVFSAPVRTGWSRLHVRVHNDLSWFMSLLGGNSPMSSGLILKMNRCDKGVSRELMKFMW
jgi:hypothetical protein